MHSEVIHKTDPRTGFWQRAKRVAFIKWQTIDISDAGFGDLTPWISVNRDSGCQYNNSNMSDNYTWVISASGKRIHKSVPGSLWRLTPAAGTGDCHLAMCEPSGAARPFMKAAEVGQSFSANAYRIAARQLFPAGVRPRVCNRTRTPLIAYFRFFPKKSAILSNGILST